MLFIGADILYLSVICSPTIRATPICVDINCHFIEEKKAKAFEGKTYLQQNNLSNEAANQLTERMQVF